MWRATWGVGLTADWYSGVPVPGDRRQAVPSRQQESVPVRVTLPGAVSGAAGCEGGGAALHGS